MSKLFVLPLFMIMMAAYSPTSSPMSPLKSLERLTVPSELRDGETIKNVFSSYDGRSLPIEYYRKNKEQLLAELANHEFHLTVYRREAGGTISYLGSKIESATKDIVVHRDNIIFKRVKGPGGEEKLIGLLFRIEAELETTKKDVDLGSLLAIGMAVKRGAANGRLRVMVYGLSGEPIIALTPTSIADISESSIVDVMERLALLKAKIYDPKVYVIPQELPVFPFERH